MIRYQSASVQPQRGFGLRHAPLRRARRAHPRRPDRSSIDHVARIIYGGAESLALARRPTRPPRRGAFAAIAPNESSTMASVVASAPASLPARSRRGRRRRTRRGKALDRRRNARRRRPRARGRAPRGARQTQGRALRRSPSGPIHRGAHEGGARGGHAVPEEPQPVGALRCRTFESLRGCPTSTSPTRRASRTSPQKCTAS